jgi:hypothetical protein
MLKTTDQRTQKGAASWMMGVMELEGGWLEKYEGTGFQDRRDHMQVEPKNDVKSNHRFRPQSQCQHMFKEDQAKKNSGKV